MTHNEFNARFAATVDNTNGYSEAELVAINDAVFTDVSHLELDNSITKSAVDHAMASHLN